MKSKIKKNLWWIISSIVLFVPIAVIISGLSKSFSDTLLDGVVFFIPLFLIWAIIGLIANKIKKVVFKILWIILGLSVYAISWLLIIVIIAMSQPVTEEDIENRKEAFRDMIYCEFAEDEHLDKVLGVQLPQYRIVHSECDYVTFFPTETEYNVELKVCFPKGIPNSVWNEIQGLASAKASNPLSEDDVINEWGISEDCPETIFYKSEDSANVGCIVTFNHRCDTVYITRYKW